MKKATKTELTREKIIKASLQEFGANGYEAASVNAVCERYHISKGLIYHNFQGKDEIYLICVERVLSELMDYMKNRLSTVTIDSETKLRAYLSARRQYFKENPLFLKIFYEAVMFPPVHLKESIEKVKKDFDSVNTETIRGLIENLKLRMDILEPGMMDRFCQSVDLIDTVYQLNLIQKDEIQALEENQLSALDIVLYGIIER